MAKILIVDDSRLARQILRSYLETAGYTVVEAANGMHALEQYVLHSPDLILLDMTMQGMQGLDVLAQLRQLGSRVPIVIATADIQESTRSMAVNAGADDLITKPFAEHELRSTIQALLGGRPCSSPSASATHSQS